MTFSTDMVRRSIERFAKSCGIETIEDLEPSRNELRRTFRLGENMFAKSFSPDERARFERERAFMQAAVDSERVPRLVTTFFNPDAGGYIVMTAVKGRLAADIHASLSAGDHASIARALGECMAAVHAVRPDESSHPGSADLVAQRRSHFDAFPAATARLRAAGILAREAIPALAEVVRRGQEQAFRSPRRLIHGELHVWNILVDERAGKPWCSMIDFEESAISHVELDFVVPVMSVLGEAFPGRRLAHAWTRIWDSFVDGYAAGANEAPNLELVVGHVVAWCLWGSARCLDHGQSRYLELARNALGAAAVLGDRRLAEFAARAAQ